MRELVRALHEEGHSRREIATFLGVSKGTVGFHVRRLGLPIDERFARRFDWMEISAAYESGLSMRECLKRFGCSRDAFYGAVRRGDIVLRPSVLPIETLLVVGRRTSRSHLKARLLKEGLKQNRCERCGIDEWLGKPLNMQLHHINGDGSDNRLRNIELICANCHSQTDTYGGRNGHRKKSPPGADDA